VCWIRVGRVFILSHSWFGMMLQIVLIYIAFIMRHVPSILSLFRDFYQERMLNFVEDFIIIWRWWCGFHPWFYVLHYAIDLHMYHPCIPGVRSWRMIFSVCCWLLLASTLLRIFAYMFIRDTYNFLFWFIFGIRIILDS
jgi:hypothetical protein